MELKYRKVSVTSLKLRSLSLPFILGSSGILVMYLEVVVRRVDPQYVSRPEFSKNRNKAVYRLIE